MKINWLLPASVFVLLSLLPSFTYSDLYNQTYETISQSAPWQWEFLGPYGGNINKIIIDTDDPQELYILVSSLGNIFYSRNQGNSWDKLAGFNQECSDMAVDPNDPERFYVVSHSCIFKSVDRGKNWETIDLGTECTLNHIAVDPLDSRIIYMTGSYGSEEYMAVYQSKNGGESWSRKIINDSVKGGGSYAIAISPSVPNIIFISGTYSSESGLQHRLYKTINSGSTWREVSNPINALALSIAFDPQDPLRIYTISSWGIYISSDGGDSWEKAKSLATGYRLMIDPVNPNIIYAGGNGCINKSIDRGETWLRYTNGLRGTCNTLAMQNSTVYLGSEYGLYKSLDEGQNWASSHQGIGNMKISLLAVSPSSPNVIYARAEYAGFYRTQDSGKTWSELDPPPNCNNISEFVVNPQNSQELFSLSGG